MKEKLTLSVDKEIVKKAKEMGINISEITENVLKGFTFEPTSTEKSALIEKYKELFKAMLPPLKKLDTTTKVGTAFDDKSLSEIGDIHLTPAGNIWVENIEVEIGLNEIGELHLKDLNEPQEILSDFIDSLSKAAERQKKKLKELEMAKKIIEAISSSVTSKAQVTR